MHKYSLIIRLLKSADFLNLYFRKYPNFFVQHCYYIQNLYTQSYVEKISYNLDCKCRHKAHYNHIINVLLGMHNMSNAYNKLLTNYNLN